MHAFSSIFAIIVCISSLLRQNDSFVSAQPQTLIPTQYPTPVPTRIPTNAPTDPDGTYCPGSQGVCNGEGVAQSWYNDQIPNLPHRNVRVRMFILANDAGNETALPIQLAQGQFSFLDTYYKPMGISFSPEFIQMNNSFYFDRRALPFCPFSSVGDGQCDTLCNASITNWDGGDCAFSEYNDASFCAANADNGVCNEQCNYGNYNWDGGDCCLEQYAITSCKDPNSPLVIYYDPYDIKPIAGPPYVDSWNIYVILYTNCPWCGAISTFPWDYNATTYGASSNVPGEGTIYNAYIITQHSFGIFVGGHELGHTFGLLHPFNGAENGLSCQQYPSLCVQACFDGVQYPLNETGSVWIGDLIADTRPMVMPPQGICENPPSNDCNGEPWTDTPFRNLMTYGYLAPNCVNASTAFTPQQFGRMRCYLETTYSAWFIDSATTASSKSKPPTALIVLLVILGAFLAGIITHVFVSGNAKCGGSSSTSGLATQEKDHEFTSKAV